MSQHLVSNEASEARKPPNNLPFLEKRLRPRGLLRYSEFVGRYCRELDCFVLKPDAEREACWVTGAKPGV